MECLSFFDIIGDKTNFLQKGKADMSIFMNKEVAERKRQTKTQRKRTGSVCLQEFCFKIRL